MEKKNKIIDFVLIILVIVLALGLFKVNYFDKPTLITVAGEGKVTVKPQMVTFTLNLFNYAASATGAISDNARLVNNATLILKNDGVLGKDIVTSYVRIVPPTSGILGQAQYQAVNTVDATLRNVNRFDSLFNTLYGAGVQSITNIVFTTENSRSLEKQAVALAMADAKTRAEEMAKLSGKRLGGMVSIVTGEVGTAGALSGQTQANLGGQIQASPTQIEIVRQASIVFELR